MSGRSVLTMTAAALALLVSGEAVPSRVAAPPLLEQVNAVRRQLGLVPLRADPVAGRVVERMAASNVHDRPPEVLDLQLECAVCERFVERARNVDPRALYRSLGGRGPIRFGLWRATWSVSDNLFVFHRAAALVLDPRARTFASAPTPLGMLVVSVTVDDRARFARAVRWPAVPVDPRHQLWTQVLLPPGYGYPNLHETQDGRDVTTAYPLAVAEGFSRARLVAFGLNTRLAYARPYRVGVGKAAVPLRTRAAPAELIRRSWRFTSMGAGDREAFLEIVAATPQLLRRLLDELDGAVEVVGSGAGCAIADACEDVDGDHATVGFTRVTDPFVVLHELGHVVFDLALDERGRRTFGKALAQAGWEGACCFRISEGFADQLAFWALGEVPAGVRSYSDRMHIPAGEFARLLRVHARYRPLPAVGPLPR